LSIDAGIDLIQHPEVLSERELPDDMVRQIVERRIVCSILSNTITGEAWQKHLKTRKDAEGKQKEEDKKLEALGRTRTSAEERQRQADLEFGLDVRRRNAEKLVRAGAVVTVGTDNYWAAAAELSRTPKPETQNHGIGTILGIEGLVELGMTPMQAIVAATANGARASKALEQYGTLEPGRAADLIVLDENPLGDIRRLRSLRMVVRDGRVVDHQRLPERRVLSAPATASVSSGR
jgi:imidazolonepropionase-like amidohydrolase